MSVEKTKGNQPGPYYVTQDCIACDACVLVAEKHFKINEAESPAFAYVSRQPQNEAEKALCQEAMEACPVEAIHNTPTYTDHV